MKNSLLKRNHQACTYANDADEMSSTLLKPSPRLPLPTFAALTSTRRSLQLLSVASPYQHDPSKTTTNKEYSNNSNTTRKSPRLLGYDISPQRLSSAAKKSRLQRFQNHRQHQHQQHYVLTPPSSFMPAKNDSSPTSSNSNRSPASHKKGK